MSTAGNMIGWPHSTSQVSVVLNRPSRVTETSVLVPSDVKPDYVLKARQCAYLPGRYRARRRTGIGGPDRDVGGGLHPHQASCRLDDQHIALVVPVPQTLLQGFQVIDHHRDERHVEDGGGESLVLENAGDGLMGRADQRLRVFLQDDLFHSPLVAPVGVGVEEAHRDGPDAPTPQDPGHGARLLFVEGGTDLPGTEGSLGDFQAVAGLDDGGKGRLVVDVPDVLLRAPGSLGQHGGDSPGGHHPHPRQAPLYQGVGPQGRPVSKGAEPLSADSRLVHGVEHPGEAIPGGRCLDDPYLSVGVHHHPVGEGSSDVYPDPELSHQIPR